MKYHVSGSKVMAADLQNGMVVKALSGESLTAALNPGRINNASIIKADIMASNGVVHVIDAVLLPMEPAPAEETVVEIASSDATLTTLKNAVTKG